MQSFLLVAAICFMVLVLSDADHKTEQPAQEEPIHSACLSTKQVNCLLNRNCTNGLHNNIFPLASLELLTGRVRFPGTASSDERRLFRAYEVDDKRRYHGLSNIVGYESEKLCFSANDDLSLDLAFRPLSLSGTMNGHIPYDVVISKMIDEANSKISQYADGSNFAVDALNKTVLITTLRDPGSYAIKWYKMRRSFDGASHDLNDASFAEWIDLAPWRMNFFTRVLGARDDRKSMPKLQMLNAAMGTGNNDDEIFLKDEYMKEQNRLGPEESEVFKLALDRLKNEFAHFGLFHRLRDSWDLLAHHFCWYVGEREIRPGTDLRGLDAVAAFLDNEKDGGVQAEELWSRLRERNRLDIALLEAADKIMDERIETMRSDKASGVICNFLGQVKVTCDAGVAEVDEEL